MYSIQISFIHMDALGNSLEAWQTFAAKERVKRDLGYWFHRHIVQQQGGDASFSTEMEETVIDAGTIIQTLILDNHLLKHKVRQVIRLCGEVAWFLRARTVYVTFRPISTQEQDLAYEVPPIPPKHPPTRKRPLEEASE